MIAEKFPKSGTTVALGVVKAAARRVRFVILLLDPWLALVGSKSLVDYECRWPRPSMAKMLSQKVVLR